MPLLDHFHPPLQGRRHWHAFHNAWATYIAADFNHRLPPGYFAEANVQFGIEIDVATFAEPGEGPATSAGEWQPPPPVLTLPFVSATDVVEVLLYAQSGGPNLAGAVELVSPANKDRQASRAAFVAKCASYLHHGIGLVVVDVVTERRANLHRQLLDQVGSQAEGVDADLYAVSYHPVQKEGTTSLHVWPHALALGQKLPELPMWLRGGLCLRLDLEATYAQTCKEYRIPLNGAQDAGAKN